MKTLLTLTLLLTGCSGAAAADRPAPRVTANATNHFTITGMHCQGCASGLTSELESARGVASASVSLTNCLATVAYDTNRVTRAKLLKVIEAAGFKGQLKSP